MKVMPFVLPVNLYKLTVINRFIINLYFLQFTALDMNFLTFTHTHARSRIHSKAVAKDCLANLRLGLSFDGLMSFKQEVKRTRL